MDKVAVLIPCYNEAKTIEKVVKDFLNATEAYGGKVYVYDNNSSDGTDDLARSAGAIVRYEYKQGKGNVMRRMFREIDAECYIIVDGDDTYSAKDAPKMIEAIFNRNIDMVIGDRLSSSYFTENKRKYHNSGNTFVKNTINRIFKRNIQDIMTGYRALSLRFVKNFPVLSSGFEIETEMTIHAIDKHFAIENQVIEYRDRPEGSVSKLDTIPDGLRVLRTILKMFRTYRPLSFFGQIALVLAILSVAFFIPVLTEYWKTGLVTRMPTLVVCCFVMLTALQSFFTGITLDTIRQKNLQDFELGLIKTYHKYGK